MLRNVIRGRCPQGTGLPMRSVANGLITCRTVLKVSARRALTMAIGGVQDPTPRGLVDRPEGASYLPGVGPVITRQNYEAASAGSRYRGGILVSFPHAGDQAASTYSYFKLGIRAADAG
jgi:hypothetical protein